MLEREPDSRELTEALLWLETEPWHADPAGYWLPRLYLLLLNCWRDRDERPMPYTLEDIMPSLDGDPLEPATDIDSKMK